MAKSLDQPDEPIVPRRTAARTAARAALPQVAADEEAASARAAERLRWTLRETASFGVSFALHVILLLALSLLVVFSPAVEQWTLVVNPDSRQDLQRDSDVATHVLHSSRGAEAADSSAVSVSDAGATIRVPAPDVFAAPSESAHLPPPLFDPRAAELVLRSTDRAAGGFDGRRGDLRGKLLAGGGGNAKSESAVALALAWLAAHQARDGGWRFDLNEPPCGGRCRNAGSASSTTAATGLALLPFLGAGQTPNEGDYSDVVNAGLYYLKGRAVPTEHGFDLQEGTMYAQGIAATALCEAYGMTKDESLREPAQRAIDFICWAQHSGGGWRYTPHSPGDTTVFGWQMMALKSAQMAGLDVPSPVVTLGERFLDSVQSEGGACYGYVTTAKSPGPTAIGLLVRMYTGWDRYDPRLKRGIAYLAREGPHKSDIYFDYYATQVMHHYDGPEWPEWNKEMRDYLVRTQATMGYERGSWHFDDPHGSKGGRLYTTAMCAMILEVYYRHMPLYEAAAVESGL